MTNMSSEELFDRLIF